MGRRKGKGRGKNGKKNKIIILVFYYYYYLKGGEQVGMEGIVKDFPDLTRVLNHGLLLRVHALPRIRRINPHILLPQHLAKRKAEMQ